MFLVRSAFWLTVAFIAMHPRDMDIGATANAISGQAIAAGQWLAVAQILNSDCSLVHCAPATAPTTRGSGAPMQTASATTPHLPSVDATMQDSSTNRPAPFPRMRPAWMG